MSGRGTSRRLARRSATDLHKVLHHLYKQGVTLHDYQPDFVAETIDGIHMLEPKARNEMTALDVLAKEDAAVLWRTPATTHARSNGGKPRKYVLIPHDVIAENMTLAELVA